LSPEEEEKAVGVFIGEIAGIEPAVPQGRGPGWWDRGIFLERTPGSRRNADPPAFRAAGRMPRASTISTSNRAPPSDAEPSFPAVLITENPASRSRQFHSPRGSALCKLSRIAPDARPDSPPPRRSHAMLAVVGRAAFSSRSCRRRHEMDVGRPVPPRLVHIARALTRGTRTSGTGTHQGEDHDLRRKKKRRGRSSRRVAARCRALCRRSRSSRAPPRRYNPSVHDDALRAPVVPELDDRPDVRCRAGTPVMRGAACVEVGRDRPFSAPRRRRDATRPGQRRLLR